jgi:hypothetical protein
MATISSSSTRQQVLDAIVDNASYLEDESIAKCKSYITALRVWLRRWAFEESRTGTQQLRYNTANAEQDLRDATRWLQARNTNSATNPGSVKQFSVEGFRN